MSVLKPQVIKHSKIMLLIIQTYAFPIQASFSWGFLPPTFSLNSVMFLIVMQPTVIYRKIWKELLSLHGKESGLA